MRHDPGGLGGCSFCVHFRPRCKICSACSKVLALNPSPLLRSSGSNSLSGVPRRPVMPLVWLSPGWNGVGSRPNNCQRVAQALHRPHTTNPQRDRGPRFSRPQFQGLVAGARSSGDPRANVCAWKNPGNTTDFQGTQTWLRQDLPILIKRCT